jgi:glyoxylase-like metal-dependent hydrolase (beta-lactamase superfamily II)
MKMQRLPLGRFEVYGLSDGYFWLDGGAMFGVVPKTLWGKKYHSDKKNRIKLSLNSLLIKTPEALILVETGIGPKVSPKFAELYEVKRDPGLLAELNQVGYKSGDIDFVINTHLHFDHCGGNTSENSKGELVPIFSRAKFIIQEGEWEDALHPNDRDKQSYLPENFLPLERFGQLQLIKGDTEIAEGVKVVLGPGHTAWHQCVQIESEGKVLFYLGDLVPTSAHVRIPYIMSYDLYPLDTMKTKKKILARGKEEDWIFAFVHDPRHYFGRIKAKNNKFEFESL